MKISIIMGAYNVEKTIARSIESIVNQTYNDWIFVICDDGSMDGTFAIMEKYKKKYPDKFIILRNENNKGLAYTLNHCLKYVQSEYVARMDADDISLPNRLKIQAEFLDNNLEYAFVGSAVERFDENGVWKRTYIKNEPSKDSFYKSSGFVHPTIMIRKAALDAVNNYRVAWFTNRCEDYDLWMRLYANGFKGYNIDEILFQYYEGKDSFPKRKYRYRICEAVMRAKGYASLNMYPKGAIFLFRPLIVGLLPSFIIKKIHKHQG